MGMDFLSQILGQAAGGSAGSAGEPSGAPAGGLGSILELLQSNPQILAAALSLLNPKDETVGGGTGLADIVGQLGQAGLGSAVASWVGGGPNQAVDGQSVADALGPDLMGQFAHSAGVAQEDAGSVLASVLPGLVNQVTPQGQVPEGVELETALASLMGQLGGR